MNNNSAIRIFRGVRFGAVMLAVFCIVSSVSAQEAAPSYYEDFDKATSDCVGRCMANPSASTTATATASADAAPARAAKARTNSARSSVRAQRDGGASATATARVDMSLFRNLEKRVAELEERVDGHDAVLEAILDQLSELRSSAVAQVNVDDSGHSESYDHSAILAALKQLGERIGKIEESRKQPFGNSVGISAGLLLLLGGSDGFSFTSPYIGVRVNLGLNDKFFLYVEPSLMVAPGDRPFSAGLGGGLGMKMFGDGEFAGAMRFGVKQVAIAIRSDLDAKAMATLGDVGIDIRLPENFRVGGDIYMGPYFTPDHDPRLTVGGDVHVGYDF